MPHLSFLLQSRRLRVRRGRRRGFGDGEVQRQTAPNSGDGLGCGEGTRGGFGGSNLRRDGDGRPDLVAASIAATTDFGSGLKWQFGSSDPTLGRVRVVSVGSRAYGLEPRETLGWHPKPPLPRCCRSRDWPERSCSSADRGGLTSRVSQEGRRRQRLGGKQLVSSSRVVDELGALLRFGQPTWDRSTVVDWSTDS
ncbi:hypothetical protein Scep_022156 [Stephania cephalantha]|uniref:Uncharacterized protein n=1 Tax=Stephania cephalantha TaxID=152367 RepID=A0AAP0I0R9_9MAGN